jgi:hypothetical protein
MRTLRAMTLFCTAWRGACDTPSRLDPSDHV